MSVTRRRPLGLTVYEIGKDRANFQDFIKNSTGSPAAPRLKLIPLHVAAVAAAMPTLSRPSNSTTIRRIAEEKDVR